VSDIEPSRLADELARRADLLDPLIDASAFDLPGPVEELVAEFRRFEAGDDYERKLDAVRRKVGELRFKLGVQLIEGVNDPVAVGHGLPRIAEPALAPRMTRPATVSAGSVSNRMR
jgi:glutamate-ammonia-ligase adenylyltransferase